MTTGTTTLNDHNVYEKNPLLLVDLPLVVFDDDDDDDDDVVTVMVRSVSDVRRDRHNADTVPMPKRAAWK